MQSTCLLFLRGAVAVNDALIPTHAVPIRGADDVHEMLERAWDHCCGHVEAWMDRVKCHWPGADVIRLPVERIDLHIAQNTPVGGAQEHDVLPVRRVLDRCYRQRITIKRERAFRVYYPGNDVGGIQGPAVEHDRLIGGQPKETVPAG